MKKGWDKVYRMPNGTVVYCQLNTVEKIMKDKRIDPGGDAQIFHTQNVLNRIQKFMPFRTGMTIKATIIQTNVRKPEIVTDTPYARYLFYGISKSGKPLNYTREKGHQSGPRWDVAVSVAEGAAMAADLQRFINRRGGGK